MSWGGNCDGGAAEAGGCVVSNWFGMDEATSADGTIYAFAWPHGWIACSTDRDDILTHFYERDEAETAAEVLTLFAEDTGLGEGAAVDAMKAP
jgi:hypothetical protein